MAHEELPLHDRPVSALSPEPSGRTPSSPGRWIAVAIGGLIAAALVTYWWMSRMQPGTTTPAPTTATEVAVGSNRPKRQITNLPPLEASDGLLRELIATLSRHPTLARLVTPPAIVKQMTLAVVQIGDGRTPAAPLNVLRPDTHLQILGSASGRIDPKSYARWDSSVAGLTSVSPGDAAQTYVNVKPLFDEAYSDLGHPGGDFDVAIVRAIQMLDDTPDLPADATLIKRTNYLEHEDAGVRALPPVQKQFLLVGPENRKELMTWFKQFAAALDLKL